MVMADARAGEDSGHDAHHLERRWCGREGGGADIDVGGGESTGGRAEAKWQRWRVGQGFLETVCMHHR
jgi:hypothetical protein